MDVVPKLCCMLWCLQLLNKTCLCFNVILQIYFDGGDKNADVDDNFFFDVVFPSLCACSKSGW